MVRKADVILENYRAGTMEAMGLGFDVLKSVNPRIILTRISGFGQDGPYSNRTCFDGAAQAMSGLMDITGAEDGAPTMIGNLRGRLFRRPLRRDRARWRRCASATSPAKARSWTWPCWTPPSR